jgi:glycogen operon protein
VKLIAEPWDVGEGGYQVGNFPPLWTEWNGKYRDSIRDFWRGEPVLPEFASRLTGSSDLYADDGRRPLASINFVTCHDGFSLRDLVSYDQKHNEANGEDNRDGTDDNRSWNHGAEGETGDPEIRALRTRQMRNFIATLFLSQGVPMLSHGDELSRTQGGNNNAYCQDNELAWMSWKTDGDLTGFVRRVSELRGDHPVFRRRRFFEGRTHGGALDGERDIVWLTPSGTEMTESDWHTGYAKAVAVYLNGDAITEPDTRGQRVRDDSFLLLLNAHSESITFRLPDGTFGEHWEVVLDTAAEVPATGEPVKARDEIEIVDRGLLLLRRLNDSP